jgi:hypothetical protein
MSYLSKGEFNYNRFDSLVSTSGLSDAYREIYEAKEECEDEDDDKKSKSKKDEDDSSKSKKKEKDEDEEEGEDEDSEEGNKKLPPWLKGKKDVKEAVIAYLIDEGFANNEVSAEIISQHMSEEWKQGFFSAIEEASGNGLTPLQRETNGSSAMDIVKKSINQKGLVGTPENTKATQEYKDKMNSLPKPTFKKVNQQANMDNAFKPRLGTSD